MLYCECVERRCACDEDPEYDTWCAWGKFPTSFCKVNGDLNLIRSQKYARQHNSIKRTRLSPHRQFNLDQLLYTIEKFFKHNSTIVYRVSHPHFGKRWSLNGCFHQNTPRVASLKGDTDCGYLWVGSLHLSGNLKVFPT